MAERLRPLGVAARRVGRASLPIDKAARRVGRASLPVDKAARRVGRASLPVDKAARRVGRAPLPIDEAARRVGRASPSHRRSSSSRWQSASKPSTKQLDALAELLYVSTFQLHALAERLYLSTKQLVALADRLYPSMKQLVALNEPQVDFWENLTSPGEGRTAIRDSPSAPTEHWARQAGAAHCRHAMACEPGRSLRESAGVVALRRMSRERCAMLAEASDDSDGAVPPNAGRDARVRFPGPPAVAAARAGDDSVGDPSGREGESPALAPGACMPARFPLGRRCARGGDDRYWRDGRGCFGRREGRRTPSDCCAPQRQFAENR